MLVSQILLNLYRKLPSLEIARLKFFSKGLHHFGSLFYAPKQPLFTVNVGHNSEIRFGLLGPVFGVYFEGLNYRIFGFWSLFCKIFFFFVISSKTTQVKNVMQHRAVLEIKLNSTEMFMKIFYVTVSLHLGSEMGQCRIQTKILEKMPRKFAQ